ncbi:HNH endonuclease [Clostridium perfringens]
MKLEFPLSFDIEYPKKNSLYYTGVDKRIILNLLMESSDGYCMYCGKNIRVDDKEEFNIEHSLEKSMKLGENNFLENCKFNLSIACPSCNQKYKTRMIDPVSEELIYNNVICSKKECIQPCSNYMEILSEYLKLNNIILQPNCIDSKSKGYSIQYNLIKHVFEPGEKCVDKEDRKFISNHIARFHLNKEMYTKSVLKVCEDLYNKITILEGKINIKVLFKLIKKERYDNILEKIFIEFLENNFNNIEDIYEYCKITLVLSYL